MSEALKHGDHPRIWLQNEADADKHNGRMWCEDKVWPDDAEDGEPTEYVRADLFEAQAEQVEVLKQEAIDNLASEIVDHFAGVAEPYGDNPLDYLLCDDAGHTLDFYKGWIAGRKDAADAIRGELADTAQDFSFWKHDLPKLLAELLNR